MTTYITELKNREINRRMNKYMNMKMDIPTKNGKHGKAKQRKSE